MLEEKTKHTCNLSYTVLYDKVLKGSFLVKKKRLNKHNIHRL